MRVSTIFLAASFCMLLASFAATANASAIEAVVRAVQLG